MANTTTVKTYNFLSDYDNAKRIMDDWFYSEFGMDGAEFAFTALNSVTSKNARSAQFQADYKLPTGKTVSAKVGIIYSYSGFEDTEKVEVEVSCDTDDPRYGVVEYADILNYTDGEFGDSEITHTFIASLRDSIISVVEHGFNAVAEDKEDEVDKEDTKSDSDKMFEKFKASLSGELGTGFGFGVCENMEELEQVIAAIRERFGDVPVGFGFFGG